MLFAKPVPAGRGVRRVLGGLCAVVLAWGLAAGSAAAAEPAVDKPPPAQTMPEGPVPGGFRSWADLLSVQEGLNAAAEEITTAAGQERGFAGIEAAPENRRLRVFWHGTVPARVAELIGKLRDQVEIELRDARHPLVELLADQQKIAAEPGVTSVAPHVDGSGLTVGFEGSEAEARAVPAIRAANVPVTIKPFDRVEETGCTGRQDDCSPYWGGARYVMPGGGRCSTGFTLVFRTFLIPPPPPAYRMLSAGHCASNNDAVTDGGGDPLGTVTRDSDAADLLLINPAANLGPRVYLDGWNANTLSNKTVADTSDSFVGNWICTTGASTGEHCSIQVDAVNVTIWGTVKTIMASHLTGGVAAGKGDSGGPVMVHQWFGDGVYALGTISAGSGQVSCPAGAPSSMCFETVYYVGILTALAHYKPPLFGSVSVHTG